MRYIIITGMNAANEALQKLITSDVIGAGFDQPGLIGDIVGKLALLLSLTASRTSSTRRFVFPLPFRPMRMLTMAIPPKRLYLGNTLSIDYHVLPRGASAEI